MEWLSALLQAFFEEGEIEPGRFTEIEISQGWRPGNFWLHMQPSPGWFAEVSNSGGSWGVALYDYIDEDE